MTLVRAGFPLEAMQGLGDRFRALPRLRRWAACASVGWVVLVGAYGIGFWSVAAEAGGMRFLDAMFLLVALVLPLLLVWLAAWLAEELEHQREIIAALAEVTAPLVGSLAATRDALDRQSVVSPEAIERVVRGAVVGNRPDLSTPLERLLAGQARAEVTLQRLSAAVTALRRSPVEFAGTEPEAPAAEQPASGPSPGPVPEPAPEVAADPAPEPAADPAPEPAPEPESDRPDWAELVRALDFPRDADDREGFRALRSALRHQRLAQMLQAAEDILNLLSQEAVFVDELPMEPVDPAAWRRFIAGTRGPEVAAVGGIVDTRALDIARNLMKTDTIFRDTALFFQRRFDAVLAEFATEAGDAELADLAGSRSGRAFMLLARLNGSLD